jgi:hypothetical protein
LTSGFFHESLFPKAPDSSACAILNFLKIRENSHNSGRTTGDTVPLSIKMGGNIPRILRIGKVSSYFLFLEEMLQGFQTQESRF